QTKLVIEQIFPGSPAAADGLKRGDGLLKVQDEEVSTLPRVQERLLSMKTGDPVALEITRGADVQQVAVTLSPRPERHGSPGSMRCVFSPASIWSPRETTGWSSPLSSRDQSSP